METEKKNPMTTCMWEYSIGKCIFKTQTHKEKKTI